MSDRSPPEANSRHTQKLVCSPNSCAHHHEQISVQPTAWCCFLAVPVGADVIAKKLNPASSLGLDILLYEPIDFAYASIAVAGFSILGWSRARRRRSNLKAGALVGALMGIVWFAVAFLVIANLHVSLGGQL